MHIPRRHPKKILGRVLAREPSHRAPPSISDMPKSPKSKISKSGSGLCGPGISIPDGLRGVGGWFRPRRIVFQTSNPWKRAQLIFRKSESCIMQVRNQKVRLVRRLRNTTKDWLRSSDLFSKPRDRTILTYLSQKVVEGYTHGPKTKDSREWAALQYSLSDGLRRIHAVHGWF